MTPCVLCIDMYKYNSATWQIDYCQVYRPTTPTKHSNVYQGPANGHLDTGSSWFPYVCLKANAEMVPSIPSCHYLLHM